MWRRQRCREDQDRGGAESWTGLHQGGERHVVDNVHQLSSLDYTLGTVSRKKVAVLLDFVQIISTPSPQFGQFVPLFGTPMCQKIWAGVSPPPPHPQIDPIYSL